MDDWSHPVKPVSRSNERGSAADRDPIGPLRVVGLISLAVLELAWLAWFLIVPLPNATNTAGPNEVAMRRAWLVLKAIPHVVPDTSFGESILGQGIHEISHFENLPQRLPIVLTALLIAAAGVGLGDLVLRGWVWSGGFLLRNGLLSTTAWGQGYWARSP